MLISMVSLRGSPGVSAAALALAWSWPRHVMVAECDPMGGQALAVFDQDGALGRRGLFQLLLDGRVAPLHQVVWRQALQLPDGSGQHYLLPGAQSVREASSLDWSRLAALFRELNLDVLADCGRLRMRGTPSAVVQGSDLTVLVLRNDQTSLRTLVGSLDVIREETGMVGEADDGLVVVLTKPASTTRSWPVAEVRKQLAERGLPVLGELPWDPAAAAALTDVHEPTRKFASSTLLARAREIASEVGRRAWERHERLRVGTRVTSADSRPESAGAASRSAPMAGPGMRPSGHLEELVAAPANPVPQPPSHMTRGF